MTAAQRQYVRLAVDEKCRTRLARERKHMTGYPNFCIGCGAHFDTNTIDCRHCRERIYKRYYESKDPRRRSDLLARLDMSRHKATRRQGRLTQK